SACPTCHSEGQGADAAEEAKPPQAKSVQTARAARASTTGVPASVEGCADGTATSCAHGMLPASGSRVLAICYAMHGPRSAHDWTPGAASGPHLPPLDCLYLHPPGRRAGKPHLLAAPGACAAIVGWPGDAIAVDLIKRWGATTKRSTRYVASEFTLFRL